jgi:hypothetical protein
VKPGESRLRSALRARHAPHARPLPARTDQPRPYDDDWGWWVEQRLERVENQLRWLTGLAVSTLAAEVVRIALAALRAP